MALLKVVRGVEVDLDHDISKYVLNPEDAYEMIQKQLQSIANATKRNKKDPYFRGQCCSPIDSTGETVNGIFNFSPNGTDPSKAFGGFAKSVYPNLHESTDHKCWDYDGLKNPNDVEDSDYDDSDMEDDQGSSKSGQVLISGVEERLNTAIIRTIINALKFRGYIADNPKYDIALEKFFKILLCFIDRHNDIVTGIYSVDMNCKSGCPGWTSHMLIQLDKRVVDNLNMTMNQLELVRLMKRANLPFQIHYVGNKPNFSLTGESAILNWSFGVGVSNGKPTFIFSDYRNSSKNQYKLYMKCSDYIATNVPENTPVLVNAHNGFEISARTASRRHVLSRIIVNGKDFLLSDHERTILYDSYGIRVVEDLSDDLCCDSCGGKKDRHDYLIRIDSMDRDMKIELNTSIIDNFYPIVLDSTSSRINTLTGSYGYELQFQFASVAGSVRNVNTDNVQFEVVRCSGVSAYVMPFQEFAHIKARPSYKQDKKVEAFNLGFGSGQLIRVELDDIPIYQDTESRRYALLRICFQEGSVALRKQLKNSLEYYYASYMRSFAVQFLVDLNNMSVIGHYVGFLEPEELWKPTAYPFMENYLIPRSERFQILRKDDALYLSNKDGVLVEEGIPSDSLYIPVATTPESDSGYYFDKIMIPITSYPLSNKFTVGDQFTIPKVLVYSSAPVAFNMTNGGCGVTSAFERNYAMYADLARPVLSGYIEIPVAFKAEDELMIEMPDIQVKFEIHVSIDYPTDTGNDGTWEIPENPEPGTGEEPPSEGDEGDSESSSETDVNNKSVRIDKTVV